MFCQSFAASRAGPLTSGFLAPPLAAPLPKVILFARSGPASVFVESGLGDSQQGYVGIFTFLAGQHLLCSPLIPPGPPPTSLY